MEAINIKVIVSTPARLHFGIVDMRGDLGRIHGSVGVAINEPRLIISATRSTTLKVIGSRSNRILEFAKIILDNAGISEGVDFRVIKDIPEHTGFGSGTQLALAVGSSISRLFDLDLNARNITMKLSRSKVSGIGTLAFQYGGFIVDGGHRVDKVNSVPPLVFHSNIPLKWRFVIGVPEINQAISGDIEKNAFKTFEPPSQEQVGETARIVLMKMIPSLIEKDIIAFGESMTDLDLKFGEYWMKVQGGRYSHPVIEAGVDHLLKSGSYGAGQSSWGPAFYGLADGEKHARELTESLNEFLNSQGRRGNAFFTEVDNKGATFQEKKDNDDNGEIY
jgi:beta-ribofuranosylaminobenzene 5'-phosphate synthase